MSFVPPAVDHVAKKIARIPGVAASYIGKDGAIDAVLETAFDRVTRQEVIQVGMRAMVPVRVFYQMPDGEMIGEDEAGQYESLEDFYTDIHVAGFAGDTPKAPPEDIGGDSYGRVSIGNSSERDSSGQLKLARIRAKTRGRPVVGWKYGTKSVKNGDRVKFKKACCLQWTMGREDICIPPGTMGLVAQMSSRRPIAYLKIGDNERVELPIHAVGHVYDVMVDPSMESRDDRRPQLRERKTSLTPTMKRIMNTVGFGRLPGQDDTPTNSANFVGPGLPDLVGYGNEPEEDMLAPPAGKRSSGRDDDRTAHVAPDEPTVKVRKNGGFKKKTILLGRSK